MLATLIATIIGSFMGLALGRYSFIGVGLVSFIIFLAISSPEIVDGVSQLVWYVKLSSLHIGPIYPFKLGFATILWSHVMFSVSFVAITVRARVAGLDNSLEEAAQDLTGVLAEERRGGLGERRDSRAPWAAAVALTNCRPRA